MAPLTEWQNFYIIIGSSAGALIGLTFVVITLMAGARNQGADRAIAAFTTPTVVHFGAVLFVSAVLSAPWRALAQPALVLGLAGLAGVLYTIIVARRLHNVDRYELVMEDWLWYAACPLVAYAALAIVALLLPGAPEVALFAIGAILALLLFAGIRNAWDLVTYTAIGRFTQDAGQKEKKE